MKRIAILIMAAMLTTTSILGLVGCDNNTSTVSSVEEKMNDANFIANVVRGIEARWSMTNADDNKNSYDDLSKTEQIQRSKDYVQAELDAIKSIKDYQFEDTHLKKLAKQYINALNLQIDGAEYRVSDDTTMYNQTWELGYCYRCVILNELVRDYGLTVSSEYQSNLDDFIAEERDSKKFVQIQEFVNDLSDNLKFKLDKEKSNSYSKYYTAIVNNTTDFNINSITIQVDFIDNAGVVVYQGSDYISNLKAGGKNTAEIYIDASTKFEKMEYNISAYWS